MVSFGVGGVADLTVRIVAQQLDQSLGQAVVIDNKPGASCWVASDAVAKAASGGHTLLLMSNATAVNAGLFKSLSFNSNCAFAPIATLGCFDITLIIKASSHFKTLAKLLAYAHVHPRLLNLGMIKVTNIQNLTAELFKSAADVDLQIIPYLGWWPPVGVPWRPRPTRRLR